MGEVWAYCLKRIVSYLEDRLEWWMGTSKESSEEFYEPFKVVSLAAATGNDNQRKKAKDWMEGLEHIVTEKRLPTSTKNMLIIQHLQKIGNDKNFEVFRNIQNDFGFHYDFEHGQKRVSKAWKRVFNVIKGLSAVIGLIILIRSALGI